MNRQRLVVTLTIAELKALILELIVACDRERKRVRRRKIGGAR